MWIHKCIYSLGMRARNGKILSCYNFLKDSETWSIEKLEAHQLTLLRDLVSNAYANSPHYKAKFDDAGLSPADIQSLSDLKLIPVTTKEEVLNNSASIQITDCKEKLFFSETSGSTGKPLVFYRNQGWDAWHNASVLRGYSWHNVHPWERNGYLWGYNIAPRKRLKVRLLDILQNRFRLFSYKDKDIHEFVDKLEDAEYLGGYSSMIYEVAKNINSQNKSDKYRLKMVKGTSEKIYEAYQIEAEKAFGRKIVSEYGSAEAGIIAFECAHGHMHINMETVLVELVDNEIVVTNLVSKSFPIIRYKLGDYIKLNREINCSCGMVHPVIDEVTGRVGSVIYGKRSSYPSLTLYYVFKNLALGPNIVLNYQVVQNYKGVIDVFIESVLSDNVRNILGKEFVKYFSDDIDIKIIDNYKRNDPHCKKKDFISNIHNLDKNE